MKILIVKYLPSGEQSNTKQLLDHLIEVSRQHEIEEVDLTLNQPPIFDNISVNAYLKRNYGGIDLEKAEQNSLNKFDNLINKVKNCDLMVVATPMHNFSFPGTVKSFFDAIMFHNETFRNGTEQDNALFVGLMKNSKALTIFSSGGAYPEDSPYGYLNNIKTLGHIMYNFMGFKDFKTIGAEGTAKAEQKENVIKIAKEKIEQILNNWQVI
jgi:FMN-dependent NADH-azoreductase